MTTPQLPRWYSVNNMGMATLCADRADAENVASDCDTEWPRQGPHRAVQLVEAPKIHYPMAEPVAWRWRVAYSTNWQLESTCPPKRPLAVVEPLYTGYMADAYIGAMEEVEIWKRRALEADEKLQAERARSGLAHRRAVSDSTRRMQSGSKLSYTENEVELIMLGWQSDLEKAVAAEREACAMVCESLFVPDQVLGAHPDYLEGKHMAKSQCSAAIRARGTP